MPVVNNAMPGTTPPPPYSGAYVTVRSGSNTRPPPAAPPMQSRFLIRTSTPRLQGYAIDTLERRPLLLTARSA